MSAINELGITLSDTDLWLPYEPSEKSYDLPGIRGSRQIGILTTGTHVSRSRPRSGGDVYPEPLQLMVAQASELTGVQINTDPTAQAIANVYTYRSGLVNLAAITVAETVSSNAVEQVRGVLKVMKAGMEKRAKRMVAIPQEENEWDEFGAGYEDRSQTTNLAAEYVTMAAALQLPPTGQELEPGTLYLPPRHPLQIAS